MILDERIAYVVQNLGFPNLTEWHKFWTAYNTRSGDFSPYSPRAYDQPRDRYDLVMRAARGERIDLRSLPQYRDTEAA